MRLAYLALVVVLVFSICGCATPAILGLKKGSKQYVPSGDPNKSCIYMYREGNYVGCLRGIFVTANGKRIGGLNSGSYFVYETEPGEIRISVENWLGKNPAVNVNVEAGKKYYLRGSLRMDILDCAPYIERVYEEEGEEAVRSLTYATLLK